MYCEPFKHSGIQSINETVSIINIRGGTHDQKFNWWDDIKCTQFNIFCLISICLIPITQRVALTKMVLAQNKLMAFGTIAEPTKHQQKNLEA
jgi:tRNA(Phe) wybutosine-synthesizing methylase Tyw3